MDRVVNYIIPFSAPVVTLSKWSAWRNMSTRTWECKQEFPECTLWRWCTNVHHTIFHISPFTSQKLLGVRDAVQGCNQRLQSHVSHLKHIGGQMDMSDNYQYIPSVRAAAGDCNLSAVSPLIEDNIRHQVWNKCDGDKFIWTPNGQLSIDKYSRIWVSEIFCTPLFLLRFGTQVAWFSLIMKKNSN